MKVYLASPFFNEREREVKALVKEKLRALGMQVCDPQNSDNPFSWEKPNSEWAKNVFQKDLARIYEADFTLAIDWGLYGDCGTAWEIAFSYSLNMPVFVIAPDETLSKPHSLMVTQSATNFISLSRFLSFNDTSWINSTDYFLYGVEQK